MYSVMSGKYPIIVVATALLAGCYSFQGPVPVMKHGSVVHEDRSGPRTGYLYERFRRATLNASGCAFEPPRRPARIREVDEICDPETAGETEMEEFLRTGYALIYADCSAYFDHMGERQRGSRLARDTIGPISALITGIVAIVRFENSRTRDDLLASLALGSTATTSALDVYDQNFLFGADNIDAVRTLILRGLTEHAAATLSDRVPHDTFGMAANHLEDNQAICRPPRILTLVRQAIVAGDIQPRIAGDAEGRIGSVSVAINPNPGDGQDD